MTNSDHLHNLVEVRNPELIEIDQLSIEEIIAIENAYEYGATYVYFRRFQDRPAVPQVYIYDLTSNKDIEREKLIVLHQRLYSSGQVPMFFVCTKSEVIIFNCFDKPASGAKLVYKPLLTIELASEISGILNAAELESNNKLFKAFSGRYFDNGSFWEASPFSSQFSFGNSAYEKLLSELKQALNDIISKKVLPSGIARRLFVISILIKYLEERTDNINNTVFPRAGEERYIIQNGKRKKQKFHRNFFDQFSQGAMSFTDVLKERGAIIKLLDYLAKHFNGGVFKLTDEETNTLQKADLRRFASFLEGNLLNGIQHVFWRLYSFNDLPVELISNIYEEFLEKSPGVVYTPTYLVNFLLDEAMPFNDDKTDFKVLDPACGSGVFLVGTYRRLIFRWRKKNNWRRPSLNILKRLLKDNIYGSDKDPDAVNLSIFSLSLALCDELTPLQIWEDLKFDNLHNENIFDEDFFKLILSKTFSSGFFDLVIGNPPFQAKLTPSSASIEAEACNSRGLDSLPTNDDGKTKKLNLPDKQIALLFLEQSIKLTKPGSLVCLIQPSAPLLYNNNSFFFRQYLFSKYSIPQIIDFTHISRVLFGKNGDVPTAAVFVRNLPSDNKGLLHITVRRTKPHKEKLFFELDTYDFHLVPKKIAISDPYIWKANFLGGARFHKFISRLQVFGTLREFLDIKIKEDGWAYGEGFIQGKNEEIRELENLLKKKSTSGKTAERLKELNKKYKKAPYITGAPVAVNEDFKNKNRLFDSQVINNETYFRYASNELLFTPPHILLKEEIKDDKIPILFSDKYLSFKHRIVGIHAPKRAISELKQLYSYLQSKLILFYLAGTSAEYMVNRSSSFLKQDLDNLPYIEEKEQLVLNEYENILLDDFFQYLLEFRRNGETSKIALKNATDSDLKAFGEVFCEVLNSVYNTLEAYPYFETESYICYPFYFKDKPTIEFSNNINTEKHLEKLVLKITGTNLRLIRVIRIYEGNVIYLIKPKQLRYWLKSIALRDADETFSDLRKQGF